MGSLYSKVKVNNPGHTFFNLSFDKKFDCDMGQLIPFVTKFCMPNDVCKFGNEVVARMNPLVSPVMHEINLYTQYYFVPLRIMFGAMKSHVYPSPTGNQTVSEWEVNDHDFETFLTGGRTGYDTSVSLPKFFPYDPVTDNKRVNNDNYVHPIEHLDNGNYTNSVNIDTGEGGVFVRGQLYFYWDPDASKTVYFYTYLTNLEYSDGPQGANELWTPLYLNEVTSPVGLYSLWDYLDFPIGVDMSSNQPLAFPFRAYNLVWNDFFRDQNLMDEINVVTSCAVKNVCWNKDYFTSAYTNLQRGQSPALPLSNSLLPVYVDLPLDGVSGGRSGALVGYSGASSSDTNVGLGSVKADGTSLVNAAGSDIVPLGSNPFVVDASGLFNVNDLRLAMRVQEWLEVNQRVGTHLNEFLIGHFGIGPNDETLQRPVYLGGSKSPVIVSEVLQTSSSDDTSPQGNMAGHGITADRNFIGSYRCKEFGVFIGVLYIRPKATYQQGIERPWLYDTKYDFPFPEFAHLGNQAIFTSELFAKNDGNLDEDGNPVVFGYTERYNELRSSQSRVSGGLRNIFDFWHLGRIFDDEPVYNADFVRCVPSKRIFAVETEPGFIVNVGNLLHFYRPIPYYGEPRT